MGSFLVLLFAWCAVVSPVPASATSVDVGISAGPHGLSSFHLAVSEYFQVSQRDVTYVRDKGIPHEDLPVVFFIAQRAHVSPLKVVSLRLRSQSWLDITYHYGLSPEIYYVPVKEVHGPPYGKAYGHYKNKPKSKWREIELSDTDVVNLVNLKFISSRYKYQPERVIKLRSEGRTFVAINDEVRKGKKAGTARAETTNHREYKDNKDKHKEKDKDKGKEKDRDKGKGGKHND